MPVRHAISAALGVERDQRLGHDGGIASAPHGERLAVFRFFDEHDEVAGEGGLDPVFLRLVSPQDLAGGNLDTTRERHFLRVGAGLIDFSGGGDHAVVDRSSAAFVGGRHAFEDAHFLAGLGIEGGERVAGDGFVGTEENAVEQNDGLGLVRFRSGL